MPIEERATKRTLESFSKETLIAFVKGKLPFWESWEREMIIIESTLKYDKLKVEVDERIAAMGNLTGPSKYKQWKANSERIDECWRMMDEIMCATYPDHKPRFTRANGEANR